MARLPIVYTDDMKRREEQESLLAEALAPDATANRLFGRTFVRGMMDARRGPKSLEERTVELAQGLKQVYETAGQEADPESLLEVARFRIQGGPRPPAPGSREWYATRTLGRVRKQQAFRRAIQGARQAVTGGDEAALKELGIEATFSRDAKTGEPGWFPAGSRTWVSASQMASRAEGIVRQRMAARMRATSELAAGMPAPPQVRVQPKAPKWQKGASFTDPQTGEQVVTWVDLDAPPDSPNRVQEQRVPGNVERGMMVAGDKIVQWERTPKGQVRVAPVYDVTTKPSVSRMTTKTVNRNGEPVSQTYLIYDDEKIPPKLVLSVPLPPEVREVAAWYTNPQSGKPTPCVAVYENGKLQSIREEWRTEHGRPDDPTARKVQVVRGPDGTTEMVVTWGDAQGNAYVYTQTLEPNAGARLPTQPGTVRPRQGPGQPPQAAPAAPAAEQPRLETKNPGELTNQALAAYARQAKAAMEQGAPGADAALRDAQDEIRRRLAALPKKGGR